MNPFISRINDQWLHPMVARLSDRQRVLRDRGNDLLTGIHERQEKLFDRGQKVIFNFEETVLERVAEMLAWAYTRTGERSEALKKTWDFVVERLEELPDEKDEVGEVLFDAEELDGIEPPAVEVEPEQATEADAEPKQAEVEAVELAPPFESYDKLNVKKLGARFNDLNPDQLRVAREYEAANKARKTVFDAIDRLLA